MQIIQSLNDTMNIIFAPSTEGFSLLDFVLVEEDDKKFLGQVIEIKNDKYELDKNIAVLKILYSINAFDEIVEYSGYTPSRDAHVELYNQKEIEIFLNENTTKFTAGLNPKTMLPLDFNIEFFKNSPVILADKLSELHTFYMNISEKLSDFENVVIFDYTGNLFIENSLRLRAGVDFKLPLNQDTLSYIWEIALSTASLETQAVCEDIFNEVKLYIKATGCDFIPFNNFVNVIEAQYAQTPVKELMVLKNRLNRYQQSKIFAQTQEELEIMPKITGREKITVLDFSFVDSVWHRAFSDYIFSTLDNNAFVLLRLNESNCNQALIEKIFSKAKNLNIIPSFSYGFKKLTNVIEYANNFVFMPTLNYSHNFGYVNNTISMLTKNYVAFFGENTKCLIFKIQNLPVQINRYEPEEKKKVKKIKLKSLNKYSNETKEEDISEYHFAPDDEIANEVLKQDDNDLLIEKTISNIPNNKEKIEEQPAIEENVKEVEEQINKNDIKETEIIQTEITNNQLCAENIIQDEKTPTITEVDIDELFNENTEKHSAQEVESENETSNDESSIKEDIEDIINDDELDLFDSLLQEESEEETTEEDSADEQNFVEIDYDENEKTIEEEKIEQLTNQEQTADVQTENTLMTEQNNEVQPVEVQEIPNILKDIDDDILITQKPKEENEFIFDEDEDVPKKPKIQEAIQDISKPSTNSKIAVSENITIDLSKLDKQLDKAEENKNIKEQELPVYGVDEVSADTNKFKLDDSVRHEKYGVGRVVKIINYASRCLLQVEFDGIGKRLLDPKIANLTIVQN